MTVIRVKGFQISADRHGKARCYHRATGHRIDLEKAPIGSAQFFAECEKIKALADALKSKQPKAGTLGGIIAIYFAEDHFKNLSDRTRRDYRKCAAFLEKILDTPVHSIDTPLIAGLHEKAAGKIGWRQANMLRTFLSEVFRHCVPKGLISANFAEAVLVKPRPRDLAYANRPWTDDERATILSLAPAHIRVALALMANTGLDPSDALNLRRDAIADGVIWARRGKTGQEVPLPIVPTMQAAFDAAPKHDALTVLANISGLPWTYNGFSTVWHRFKAKQVKAGVIPADLTLKSLRHTVATVLREAGVHPREIADLLGQKTESMAHHYSRNARLTDSNRKTIETLEVETERRIKIVKPFPKTVKP
ncbi:tyrosine-type recombinase/integrase [Cypionkella aquatica]|uniref:tyrosine-type recombinase/integrase n=1 Tax=Cypionkella aquatica TaxID=1756042 RepID=UPI0024E06836|nr:tyrosine-type recombinase/integrase [Cypionkella aquatica]